MKLARLHQTARPEPYWHVQLAIVVAIILQLLPSSQVSLGPKFAIAGAEVLLLVALTIFTASNTLSVHLRRSMAILLIAIISLVNLSSLVLVIQSLLQPDALSGQSLLFAALAIYLTNIIIFGLWYWELDDPHAANNKQPDSPAIDFLFPQASMAKPWSPSFFDYLYISVTNASAFSPTDTLPLTHRAKLLMTFQSLTSLITIALVAARAVNILS